MSTTPVTGVAQPVPPRSGPPLASQPLTQRRVRHQARDAVALMSFSAATSLAIAAVLLLAGVVLGSGR